MALSNNKTHCHSGHKHATCYFLIKTFDKLDLPLCLTQGGISLWKYFFSNFYMIMYDTHILVLSIHLYSWANCSRWPCLSRWCWPDELQGFFPTFLSFCLFSWLKQIKHQHTFTQADLGSSSPHCVLPITRWYRSIQFCDSIFAITRMCFPTPSKNIPTELRLLTCSPDCCQSNRRKNMDLNV